MKRIKRLPVILSIASLWLALPVISAAPQSKFRHVRSAQQEAFEAAARADSIAADSLAAERLRVRNTDEIIASLPEPDFKPTPVNKTLGPWVFLGYRNLQRKGINTSLLENLPKWEVINGDSIPAQDSIPAIESFVSETLTETPDSTVLSREIVELTPDSLYKEEDLTIMSGSFTPKWLRDALTSYRIQEDFMYSTMVSNPSSINYSYWDLPVPPRLLEDDVTFAVYMRRLQLPDIDVDKAILPEDNFKKKHWLHNVGASLHFSQAYVSSNWYQGGNNHLALLFNFNWTVQLNQVYHPDLLFQSALSYKLGMNSTPNDEVHRYSISEDALQYNLNTGVKAFKKWFYSLNAMFKTQILPNYEPNSSVRSASFLSPGDLNIGLGMAYSHQNENKTLQLTATISPLSYNLKTCITDKIDHTQFNIDPWKKSRSEFGSNGEFNMLWLITPNISYKTRVFVFTDYSYFLSDWENTFSFDINRFLSTQIYVHLRYDTSTEALTKWKHLQLREVLSFGLSYTFSTKP